VRYLLIREDNIKGDLQETVYEVVDFILLAQNKEAVVKVVINFRAL
jgi:hypothetical protein